MDFFTRYKYFLKHALFSTLLVIVFNNSIAQTSVQTPKHSVEQLKNDLSILRENLETVHIGLYDYSSKKAIDSAFTHISSSITEPLTSLEFYRKIAPLNSLIKNGHTALLPSSAYDQLLRSELPRFPLGIYQDQGKVYVLENYTTNDHIKEGTEIKSINGQKAISIFNFLLGNWTRDGYNLTKPALDISKNFDFFYAYFIGTPENYTIELYKNGHTEIIELKGLSKTEIDKRKHDKYGESKKYEKALKFNIDSDRAVMTISDFSTGRYKDTGQDYKEFFQESFNKLKEQNIQHLIIDLRDNTGGNAEPTTKLFSYLYHKPFQFYKSITLNIKRLPNPQLYQNKISLWNLTSWIYLKKVDDLYHFKRGEYGLKTIEPSTPQYMGEVYVLINGDSFSATGELVSFMKEHNIGIFIGEEAGGNANHNVSGYRPILALPNTGIRALIPTEKFLLNVNSKNTGHGVTADHYIRPSVDDIINNRDVVMEFTQDLIDEQ